METKTENREFLGVWVPALVYLSKECTWSAKVIFLEIHSFTAAGKECFASNEYFAEFCDITATQASRHISKLKSIGWIEQTGFDGKTRTLKSLLSRDFTQGRHDKKRKADQTKKSKQGEQKAQSGHDKKRKDTNTTTNTTTNTPTNKPNAYAFLQEGDYAFFVDIYFKFHDEQFSRPPKFNEVDGKKLKEILKKLEYENRRSSKPWSRPRGEALLKQYLKIAIGDKWLKENFELSNLDSKFNSIINKAATNAIKPITTPFDKKQSPATA